MSKKKGLKAWQILLIVLGGIFALLGLFFCFIIWLAFSFGTTEDDSTNSTVPATVAQSEIVEDENKYTLDSENSIGNILYYTPSDFQTSGTDGENLLHLGSNGINIISSYVDIDLDTSTFDDEYKQELMNALVEGFTQSEGDFTEEKSVLTKVKGCYGLNYVYRTDTEEMNLYAFFYDEGCYLIACSCDLPVTDENERLFEDVINSIVLK